TNKRRTFNSRRLSAHGPHLICLERRTRLDAQLCRADHVIVRQRLRILVVDDDGRFAASLARVLARDSEVVRAPAIAAARPLLDSVDAVITDVGLPDGDGIQIVEEASHLTPRPSCILMSGSVDRERLSAAHALGVSYLLKPLDAEQLEVALERIRASKAT